jgi:hypothetical protein
LSPDDLKRLRATFRPSTDLAYFPVDHVDFDNLVGERVAESRLVAELTQRGDRGRVAVIGPSGSGKSSMIASTLARLRDHHIALIIQVGNAGPALQDTGAFARFVLEELGRQVDTMLAPRERGALEFGAATRRTRARGQRGAQVTLRIPLIPLDIAAELKTAVITDEVQVGSPTAVVTLRRAVDIIGAHERRPVLVLDDTDKWAGGVDGGIDRDAADAFFRHGVRILSDIDCDLIVAVHDRFLALETFRSVAHFFTEQIMIPRFPDPRQPLADILTRRLDNEGVTAPVDELLSIEALTLLEAAYAERAQNLRFVLQIMHEGIVDATGHDAGVVDRLTMYHAAERVRNRFRT